MILLKEVEDCITLEFIRNPKNPLLDPILREQEAKKKSASKKSVSASDLEKKYSGRAKFDVNVNVKRDGAEEEVEGIGHVKRNTRTLGAAAAAASSPSTAARGAKTHHRAKRVDDAHMTDFFDENGDYINGEEYAKKLATKKTVINEQWVLPALAPDNGSFFDYHSDKPDILAIMKAKQDRYRDPDAEESGKQEITDSLTSDTEQFLKSKKILSKTMPAPLLSSLKNKNNNNNNNNNKDDGQQQPEDSDHSLDRDKKKKKKERESGSPSKRRDISSAPLPAPASGLQKSNSMMVLPQQLSLDSTASGNNNNNNSHSHSSNAGFGSSSLLGGANQQKTIDDIINSIEVDSIASKKLKELQKTKKNSFKISTMKGFVKDKKQQPTANPTNTNTTTGAATADEQPLALDPVQNPNPLLNPVKNPSIPNKATGNSVSTAPNLVDLAVSDGFTIKQNPKKKEEKEGGGGCKKTKGGKQSAEAITVGLYSTGGFFFPVLLGSKPIDTNIVNNPFAVPNPLGGLANRIAATGMVSMDLDDKAMIS